MSGAAPACRRRTGLFFAALPAIAIAAVLVGSATAARTASGASTPVRAVVIGGRMSSVPASTLLRRARRAGFEAVVTDSASWSPERHSALVTLAERLRLLVIEPRQPPASREAALALRHACAPSATTVLGCAIQVDTVRDALALASKGAADYVVVPLKSPSQLGRLRAFHAKSARLIGIVSIARKLDPGWARAISAAAHDRHTIIAFDPAGSNAALASYLAPPSSAKSPAEAPTSEHEQPLRHHRQGRDRDPVQHRQAEVHERGNR